MLKIRLSMIGAKKRPIYKIVVADSRFPRDGRFIEKVGFFNPLLPKTKKERFNLKVERIKHWISKGAKPTSRVSRILGEAEIFPMPSKGNNPQKAIPKKDRKKGKVDGEKLAVEGVKAEVKKEASKAETKKEEPKKDVSKATPPKTEEKKEAPKAEQKKAETKKEEPKKDVSKATPPKTEEKKEAPKAEQKKAETKKEEPKKK